MSLGNSCKLGRNNRATLISLRHSDCDQKADHRNWLCRFETSRRHYKNKQQTVRLCFALLFSLFIINITLTGFVCAYKIQAEEECLSSNVICYECDSRYDPSCADPFDFSTVVYLPIAHNSTSSDSSLKTFTVNNNRVTDSGGNSTVQNLTTYSVHSRKLPATAVCHGCCVKITSKTPDGVKYVKRTCTTNLQINYFMVGLVCMKESGDRGKMCFCESDYCNGAASPTTNWTILSFLVALTSVVVPLRLGFFPSSFS